MNPVTETINNGNPWLVDIPIRVKIWIRPDLQKRQFDSIRKARPSVLFLDSDGGRNEEEWDLIRRSRAVFDAIDWTCEVHRIFHDENLGMYASGKFSSKYIWERVDRALFLEDDIQFSDSFIPWCAEMLAKYADDERIFCVCGMNHEGVSEGVPYDYFFSREASIWGIATWRRAIEERGVDYAGCPYTLDAVRRAAKDDPFFRRCLDGYAKDERYGGHVAGGEFWNAFAVFGQNQLYIVPKKNMVSNAGCTENSAHADDLKLLPKGVQRVFNMETYECSFPLRHPICVVPDVRYQKRVYRIMAHGHPAVWAWRKASRALRTLLYKGPGAVAKRALAAIKRDER